MQYNVKFGEHGESILDLFYYKLISPKPNMSKRQSNVFFKYIFSITISMSKADGGSDQKRSQKCNC